MISTLFGKLSTISRIQDGPLLVLLHGIQGRKELFTDLISEPGLAHFSIVAPDFLGFGESDRSETFSYTITDHAAAIEELVVGLGYHEVTVVGHSLGGMVGTKLLESKVITLKGLISLEGNLTLADCGASKDVANLSAIQCASEYLPNLIEKLENSTEPSSKFRSISLRAVDSNAFYHTAVNIVETSRSESLLKLFTSTIIPRLLLVGEKSTFGTRPSGRNLSLKFIPNAAHFMLHDNYNATAGEIYKFLSKLYEKY